MKSKKVFSFGKVKAEYFQSADMPEAADSALQRRHRDILKKLKIRIVHRKKGGRAGCRGQGAGGAYLRYTSSCPLPPEPCTLYKNKTGNAIVALPVLPIGIKKFISELLLFSLLQPGLLLTFLFGPWHVRPRRHPLRRIQGQPFLLRHRFSGRAS